MTGTRTLEIERRMEAPPEDVFGYFTDPDLHLLWSGIAVELDPRPGGAYVVSFAGSGEIRGEYVELEPPRRLVLNWGWSGAGDSPMSEIAPGSTRVEIEFLPEGDGTLVRVRHTGFPSVASAEATTWGWATYIDRLVAVCTGAEVEPDPVATLGAP